MSSFRLFTDSYQTELTKRNTTARLNLAQIHSYKTRIFSIRYLIMQFLKTFCLTLLVVPILLHFIAPDSQPTAPARQGQLTQIDYIARLDLRKTSATYTAPTDVAQQFTLSQPGQPDRTWFGRGPAIGQPRPAIVLLHGSGRPGLAMIDMWKETAARNQLVLIAPNSSNPQYWDHGPDGTDFMTNLLEQAQDHFAIDPTQIYLMGHSAGGLFAQQLALRNTGQWRAITTHGAAIDTANVHPTNSDAPLFIYNGDKDHLFPTAASTATAQALAEAGQDTTQIQIPDHTHWYYKIGPQIAPDMWNRMKASGK